MLWLGPSTVMVLILAATIPGCSVENSGIVDGGLPIADTARVIKSDKLGAPMHHSDLATLVADFLFLLGHLLLVVGYLIVLINR